MHLQISTPAILKNTIEQFEKTHRIWYHFDEEGSLQRIIPIPHKDNKIHLAIILDHELVIKYQNSYIPTDKESISLCKQISKYKICKRNQPDIKLLDSNTCKATFLKRYANVKCSLSLYLLHKETYIPISNGYIVIPVGKFQIEVSCENRIEQIPITSAIKVTGKKCKFYRGYDSLDLNTQTKENYTDWLNVACQFNHNKEYIKCLEDKLMKLPNQITNEEFKKARLSQDDTENMLNTIAIHRRVKTWTETGTEWLHYAGYTAVLRAPLYDHLPLPYTTGRSFPSISTPSLYSYIKSNSQKSCCGK